MIPGRLRLAFSVALVFVLSVALPLLQAPRAYACSCDAADPVRTVGSSGAAFVGVATEVFEVEDAYGEPAWAASFDVIEVVKGDVGDTVVLRVKSQEDSCGPPRFLPGWRDTYFGRPASVAVLGGSYAAEACAGLNPTFLPQGPRALPAPQPDVAADVVWLGEWMGTSLRLVGPDGAISAYAEPTGIVGYSAAMCGSGAVLVHAATAEGVTKLVWRDLVTMQIVAERLLPETGESPFIGGCSADLRVIAALSGPHPLQSTSVIFDGHDLAVEVSASSFRATISADGAVAAAETAGGAISIVAIDSGKQVRAIAAGLLSPGQNYGMALSADGSHLAVITHDGIPHLTVIAPTGEVIVRADVPGTNAGNGIWWLDADTVAVVSDDVHLVSIDKPDEWKTQRVAGSVVSHAGSRVLTRSDPSDRYVVTDLTNGDSFDVAMPVYAQQIVVLPRSIIVQGDGYVPSATLPLPGIRLPSTLDELLALGEPDPQSAAPGPRIVLLIGAALIGCLFIVMARIRLTTEPTTTRA